ncbi:hypothetical protein [Pleomorphomonas sp. NRK KF1]|uniref:hypothetical protein n=1 Tax=Pleomorphomonas sp. NRK KF1 TaxID=2943000 RepID=UPI0020438425|nr:hypothetical protein [Pleomorphomonas sp. NRK KF1]MCM5555295.1 hypothetical protein [Pleomorphomonas sp. NRK KF1]
MSDSILRYVPKDPFWQPSSENAEKAVALLRAMAPKAESVEANFEDEVRFYDPGESWSGVACNACGADAWPWWNGAMEASFASGFTELDLVAPCCGAHVSLNELRYGWPAAFGRFALEALNPLLMEDTTEDQDRRIGDCLGKPVRKIWVRL